MPPLPPSLPPSLSTGIREVKIFRQVQELKEGDIASLGHPSTQTPSLPPALPPSFPPSLPTGVREVKIFRQVQELEEGDVASLGRFLGGGIELAVH